MEQCSGERRKRSQVCSGTGSQKRGKTRGGREGHDRALNCGGEVVAGKRPRHCGAQRWGQRGEAIAAARGRATRGGRVAEVEWRQGRAGTRGVLCRRRQR
jgi:hypothetical protein